MTRRGRPASPRPRRVSVTISQPAALVERVQALAVRNDVPMSQLWQRAMIEYLMAQEVAGVAIEPHAEAVSESAAAAG